MALSATFTANFSSFYDAVDKADAVLKDFGAGADRVGGRLNTLANQFSGQKIVQEATIMAKAVEEIGGVSKLTEKELARLGATTNEAVNKMKALGMDVPKNLQEIADQTKNANKQTTDWMGALTKVGSVLGIAFGVDAIKQFIGSVFDAAGAVKDLSDQWGVSTKFVQQWSAAAKQSGVESEQLGKSIQTVTEKLSESSPEYEALLNNIGLSTEALRKMSTEDAYKEIINKIAGIKDETLQLDVAMGILGPSAKKIIGGIRDGMYDAADAQKYMSDETIKRLEQAGDAWERFKNNVIIYSGEMLASTAQVTGTMTQSWSTFFHTMALSAKDAITGGAGSAAAFLQMKSGLDDYQASLKNTGKDIKLVTAAEEAHAGGMKTTAQIQAELRAKTDALAGAEKSRAKIQDDAKKAQDDWNKRLQAEYNAVIDLKDAFAGRGLIAAALEYVEALKTSIPISEMTEKQIEKIHQVMDDALEVYAAAGTEAPQAMYDIWAATIKAAESTETYTEKLQALAAAESAAKSAEFAQGLGGGGFDPTKIGESVTLGPKPKASLEEFDKAIQNLAASFAQLAQISDGAFGDITQDIGTVLGAMALAEKSSTEFQKGLGQLKAGNVTQGFAQTAAGAVGVVGAFQTATKETGKLQSTLNGAAIGFSVAGPWGAAVGGAIGLIKGFFNEAKKRKELYGLRDDFIASAGGINALTVAAANAHTSLDKLLSAGNKDQLQQAIANLQASLESAKLRDAFVAAQGGVDALTKAAETAGISVDALFAAKSTDEVKKSIKDIEDALQFQEDAMQLAIDTAQKYGFTLEELGPAMQRQELDKQAQQLYKDWQVLNSAGIDTVAISKRMSESVSKYVQDATKMGTEVPEAMRPMLESMAKSGTLLDENGNAITNLEDSGVSFAMSMSDGFKKLIDGVEKLTDAISRGLGLAIKDIPQPKIKGEVSWDVKPIATPKQASGGQELESYQGGTDGFRNFGKGTPVMLHGWEAVVPREESGAFATVGPGGGAPAASMPAIVINAQGAFFDTPESLQRLANKVSDALTAKFSLMGKLRAAV